MAYSEINAVGIIPARYNSSRFPGKPLVDIDGKSMIHRVYDQAMKSKLLSKVYIATDDKRIFEHVKNFTDNVLMTSENHTNGTERVAEAIEILEERNLFFDIVANIQGDEPYIFPQQIDEALSVLINNENAEIATLIKEINYEDATDPNRVKVVISKNNKALYFSRQIIPFYKVEPEKQTYYKHIGLYVFRTIILKEIVKLDFSVLERAESLEQLRWLDNDYKIFVEYSNYETISIDTPEDLNVFVGDE
ncbi:3-deoxy-manno-octulosonate cytidylyltransferase [Bacteroidales bacterium OttesenSCG-928-K22]|nr:3-deoxy-manno-octulosonate cytidylyltransferase [Bacteroidales bacterium OttesenSCG-928-L14]MDL2241125.1 3-deoxy-manno-octulosonate cytidylyltransferase [Bacteroidales bacterium OttesenSCG-928-K22]